jgi:hypothetical protein
VAIEQARRALEQSPQHALLAFPFRLDSGPFELFMVFVLPGVVRRGPARNVGTTRLRGSPAAATKAFTSQVVALTLFTVRMGRLRGNLGSSRGGPSWRRSLGCLIRSSRCWRLNDAIRELAHNNHLLRMVDHLIPVPGTVGMLTPIRCTMPLQLCAYYEAVMWGCDVDMPRNPAESVTVE